MRTDGKVSKVAICEKCNNFVMGGHVDRIDKKSEKEFTELSNEGFTIKLETIQETQARGFSPYSVCIAGECTK